MDDAHPSELAALSAASSSRGEKQNASSSYTLTDDTRLNFFEILNARVQRRSAASSYETR